MNIIIENLTNKEEISKFEKLKQILQGGTLFDDVYRFVTNESKCYFEIERYYFENPIKESKLLFIFPQYVCGAIRSAIEVFPVMKVEESKHGYEDLEIGLSRDKKRLEIGTYKHTFSLTISEKTVLKIYDISSEAKTPPYGYFSKRHWRELNDIIKELSF